MRALFPARLLARQREGSPPTSSSLSVPCSVLWGASPHQSPPCCSVPGLAFDFLILLKTRGWNSASSSSWLLGSPFPSPQGTWRNGTQRQLLHRNSRISTPRRVEEKRGHSNSRLPSLCYSTTEGRNTVGSQQTPSALCGQGDDTLLTIRR